MFGLLLVLLSAAFSKENDNTLGSNTDYIVQIREDWLDVVKLEAPRFGLDFKRKLGSNVYLFGEIARPLGHNDSEEKIDTNIRDFTEFFADKIVEIEHRKYVTVKYHLWRHETTPEPRTTEFGRWLLQRRTHAQSKACWPYYGMGVQDAWSLGFTGLNIRVAVVDTGVEMNHPDLKRNIDKEMSYSFVDDDHTNINPQRFPSYREMDEITSHGTMAAGLIAAEFGNDRCSAGVAFESKLVALKVFRLQKRPARWKSGIIFSLDHVAAALGYRRNEIDVYSCSFNLDNQFTAPSLDMRTALRDGAEQGRNGKGNIFVFSSGDNNGEVYDCNMDYLANSIYTITISSVGKYGSKPTYAIPCACTLASTYGEFKTYAGPNKLESTSHDGRCRDVIGTSVSAALASGIIAQTVQANTKLTWRDMQYILILTSSFEQLQNIDRIEMNAIGLQYDVFFGFGLVNATAMVLLAQQWTTVPKNIQHTIHETKVRYSSVSTTAVSLRYDGCTHDEHCVRFLEHVIVHIRYTTSEEPFLDIVLCSPANTCSNILNRKVRGSKKNKRIKKGTIKRTWNFTSVHFWGENPKGSWCLLFQDIRFRGSNEKNKTHFSLQSATITLAGTALNPYPDSYKSNIHVRHNDSDSLPFTNGICEILKDISVSETVDGVLDYVEETTHDLTNYWTVIVMFLCFTLCIGLVDLIRIVNCVYWLWRKISSKSSNVVQSGASSNRIQDSPQETDRCESTAFLSSGTK